LLTVTIVHVLALAPLAGLLAVAFVVCLCSIDATWPATFGVALLGWLFLDGFVTNNLGKLQIDGSRDEWWLVLLVGVAVTTAAVSRAALRSRAPVRWLGVRWLGVR
jgi:hypothetical protein